MDIKKIRNIIREEFIKLINETGETATEPKQFAYHGLVGKVYQYQFYTESENGYYLNFFPEETEINNQEILNRCEGKCDTFYDVSFASNQSDLNNYSAYTNITRFNEQYKVLQNVIWLLKNFIENNPNINNYSINVNIEGISEKERKKNKIRIRFYKNYINKQFNDDFFIFNDIDLEGKKYIIMIKR